MKLSMSMLEWYLREHHPQSSIQNDSMVIQGIRFHQDETRQLQPEYVYFSHAETWFADPKYAGAYLIAQGQSTMFFWDCDYDELLNSLLSAFDFFNSWESRLLDAASKHLPLQEMLEIAEDVINNPITVADISNKLLAFTNTGLRNRDEIWLLMIEKGIVHPAVSHDLYYDSKGELIRNISDEPRIVRNVFPGGSPVMMMYLKQGDEMLAGFTVLQENPRMTAVNRQLLPVLSRYFVQAEEFTTPSGSARSIEAVFKDILDEKDVGEVNLQRINQQMQNDLWRIMVLRHISRMDMFARTALTSELRQEADVLFPMIYGEGVIALVRNAFYAKVSTTLNIYNFCVGVSMPFRTAEQILLRYQQAKFAIDQANLREGLWRCEDFAFDYMISILCDQEVIPMLLHPALEQLEQYDRENQSDLTLTLSTYLYFQQNQNETAQALHIHNNTLKYRLRRIREITGLTLEAPEELKYLRLSNWLSKRYS